ncbi:hypothetical protein CCY01nite_39900 [Chitinophaga cymbidii]|uniref:Uncharacterized protein n=1 Tax=Chitinophaga cymbidii TaxID=1096750 RepID=A0A512RPW0_9BACT|nr:hypothetical protein CCY01nite_39900 [Chitinophaga cymbidii]
MRVTVARRNAKNMPTWSIAGLARKLAGNAQRPVRKWQNMPNTAKPGGKSPPGFDNQLDMNLFNG